MNKKYTEKRKRGQAGRAYVITVVSLLICQSIYAQENAIERAEKLFQQRDIPGKLEESVTVLNDYASKASTDYAAFWRLSKFTYYLSDEQKVDSAKEELLQAGIEAGQKAIQLKQNGPEGHYWYASNCGQLANIKHGFKSLTLIHTIRSEFQTAMKLDPNCENGGAFHALGEMDLQLPFIFGGSDKRGIEILQKGVKIAPTNLEMRLALAEALESKKQPEEAIKLLTEALAIDDPNRTSQEREYLREKARKQLQRLEAK